MVNPSESPLPVREGRSTGRPSGLAIWSFVLGLFGFLWIPAVPGLILGIIALQRIRGSKGKLGGKGLAIAGLVLSGLALIVAPKYVVPAANRLHTELLESKAVRQSALLQAGLSAYLEEYGHPPVLRGDPPSDVHTAGNEGLILVLQGRSREWNPRGKVFLPEGEDGFLDPWGRPFQIVLDGNEDGRITLPGEGEAARIVESRVLVRSYGKDGKPGGGDDVLVY